MLFCMMFDYVVKRSLTIHKGVKYKYDERMNYHGGSEIEEKKKVTYADDTVILSTDEEDVNNSLNEFDNNTRKCGMKISYEKTMILVDQPERKRINNRFIVINGIEVKMVNNVKHLGRIHDNGLGKTQRHRINKARGCFMK